MPNRIVREGIITSEPVNSLTWPEEVFYRRLHSVVDDYGRYHANLSLLRAACYPLRLNDVSDQDVGKWLSACESKGLVRVYEVDGKRYLEVEKFAQQVRAKASKFPSQCSADAKQVLSTRKAHAPVVEVEVGVVVEGEKPNVGLPPDAARLSGKNAELRKAASSIIEFLNAKAGRNFDLNGANADHVLARLKDGETVEDCRAVIALKCREWRGDPKMSKYLRPETLFNRTKFSSYKGELVVPDEKA